LELWYFGQVVKKAKDNKTANNISSGGSYFVSASNAAQVDIVDTGETVAATYDVVFAQRAKVIIHFSCEITIDTGAANLTAKTYVDGVALTYQPTLYCAGANTYTLSYHDIKLAIAAGTKTIEVKLQTDANGGAIAAGQAVMTVQVYIDATPGIYDPQGFTATVISDTQIDLAWTNPASSSFSIVELYRHTADLAAQTRAWCDANATLIYNSTGESYNDTGRTDETLYYYKIFAVYVNDSGTYYSSGVSGSETTDAPAGATAGYVFGGLASNFLTHLADNDQYIPDAWTSKTDVPYGVHSHAAATISGLVYLFSGKEATSTWSNNCYEYNSSGNSWAAKTDVVSPDRAYLAGSEANSKGYIYGGSNSTPTRLQDCDEYNQSGNSWANKTSMPSPAREYLAGSSISNKCYTYCGETTTQIQDCDEYTASGDSWASKTDAPAPARRQLAACTISTKGYIFGGYSGVGSKDCDEYDPSGDSWTSKTDMTNANGTQDPGACDIGTKGYTFAGYTNAVDNECNEFDPVGNSWAAKTDVVAPTRYSCRASSI